MVNGVRNSNKQRAVDTWEYAYYLDRRAGARGDERTLLRAGVDRPWLLCGEGSGVLEDCGSLRAPSTVL